MQNPPIFSAAVLLSALASLGAAAPTPAPTPPAAPIAFADSQNLCQVTAPGDWRSGAGGTRSPDGKTSFKVEASPAGTRWTQMQVRIKSTAIPTTTFEDSPARYFFQFTPAHGGDFKEHHWFIAVPGKKTICTATVTMKNGDDEIAKAIAMSLKAL